MMACFNVSKFWFQGASHWHDQFLTRHEPSNWFTRGYCASLALGGTLQMMGCREIWS